MSSRTWLAVVVFVFMAVLTIVSLVCCGMAMSRSFAYEADIRNNEQRLNDIQQAVEQKQSQNEAQSQRYLDDQRKYQTHLTKMVLQMQEQSQLRANLEKDLPQRQGEYEALIEQIKKLTQEKQNLETFVLNNAVAKNEIEALKAEKLALEAEHDKLHTERDVALSEKSKAEADKRNAENSYAEQKRKLDATTSELTNMQQMLETARAEKDKLDGEFAWVKKEVETLRSDLERMKTAKQSIGDLTKQKEALVNDIANLQKSKQDAQEAWNNISKDLAEATASQKQLNELRKEVVTLESQRDIEQAKLNAIRKEIVSFDEQKKQLEQLNKDLTTKQGEVLKAQEDYAQAIQNYNAVKAQLGMAQGTIDSLNAQRTEAEAQQKRAQQQRDEALKELASVTGQVSAARRELNDLYRQLEEAQKKPYLITTPKFQQREEQNEQQQ